MYNVLTGRFNECILLRITVCADCDVACYIRRRSRNLGTTEKRAKVLALPSRSWPSTEEQ